MAILTTISFDNNLIMTAKTPTTGTTITTPIALKRTTTKEGCSEELREPATETAK